MLCVVGAAAGSTVVSLYLSLLLDKSLFISITTTMRRQTWLENSSSMTDIALLTCELIAKNA